MSRSWHWRRLIEVWKVSLISKRLGMADIKDSGDIEQDMDVGLLLYREEYYDAQTEAKGLMEINVAKNRNGATGTCNVVFAPIVGKLSNKG
jgi:replicative DNA helicase